MPQTHHAATENAQSTATQQGGNAGSEEGTRDHRAHELADVLDHHIVLVDVSDAKEAKIVDGASLHNCSRFGPQPLVHPARAYPPPPSPRIICNQQAAATNASRLGDRGRAEMHQPEGACEGQWARSTS